MQGAASAVRRFTVTGAMNVAAHPVLIVNVRPGCSNTGLLQVTRGLAELLDARVVGVGAWQPMPIDWTGGDYIPSNFPGLERTAAEAAINGAEAEFRIVFPAPDQEWRSSLSFASPSKYIVEQVRHADLVLTGTPPCDAFDTVRAVAGDLVMQCGRPVIVVPNTPETYALDQVMVAWQDTSEGRRAALDALPLLQRAAKVTIVEVAAKMHLSAARQRLADVSRWLAGHGVRVDTQAAAALHDDAEQLVCIAHDLGANLVVAGAYGHSRRREWAFGGVTRTLLLRGTCCTLLSH